MNYYHAFTSKFDVGDKAYMNIDGEFREVEIEELIFINKSAGTDKAELSYDVTYENEDYWGERYKCGVQEDRLFNTKLEYVQSIFPDVESLVFKDDPVVTDITLDSPTKLDWASIMSISNSMVSPVQSTKSCC